MADHPKDKSRENIVIFIEMTSREMCFGTQTRAKHKTTIERNSKYYNHTN